MKIITITIILLLSVGHNFAQSLNKTKGTNPFFEEIEAENNYLPRIDTVEDFAEGDFFNCGECRLRAKFIKTYEGQILYAKIEPTFSESGKSYEYFRIDNNSFKSTQYIILNDTNYEPIGKVILNEGNYEVTNKIFNAQRIHYYLQDYVAHKEIIKTDFWSELIIDTTYKKIVDYLEDDGKNEYWLGFYKNGKKSGIWKHKTSFQFWPDNDLFKLYKSDENDIEFKDYDEKDTTVKISKNNIVSSNKIDTIQKYFLGPFELNSDIKTQKKLFLNKNIESEDTFNSFYEFKSNNQLTIQIFDYQKIVSENVKEKIYKKIKATWSIKRKKEQYVLLINYGNSKDEFEITYLGKNGNIIITKI